MIIKVLDLEHKESSKTYLDDHEISNWAIDSLIISVENGIMSGYPDHTLRPQNNATRAEAVTIIVRAMDFTGK